MVLSWPSSHLFVGVVGEVGNDVSNTAAAIAATATTFFNAGNGTSIHLRTETCGAAIAFVYRALWLKRGMSVTEENLVVLGEEKERDLDASKSRLL
jgi:ABC-type Fe3+-siderophore transport system permease subunit